MTPSEQSNIDFDALEEIAVDVGMAADELWRQKRIRLAGLLEHVRDELRAEIREACRK